MQIYEPIFIEVDEEDERNYEPEASLPAAPSVSDAWSAYSGGECPMSITTAPSLTPLAFSRTARSHDPSMQDSDGDSSSATVMDVREDGDSDAPDAPNPAGGGHCQAQPKTKAKRLRHGFVPSQIEDWNKSVRAREPVLQQSWWQGPVPRAASPTHSMVTESSIASSASSVSTVRDYANENKTVGTYLIGGPGPLGDGQPMSRVVAP